MKNPNHKMNFFFFQEKIKSVSNKFEIKIRKQEKQENFFI